MICQTDLLQKLVEGGLRVGLLVPDCSDPSMTVLRDRWGVELHEYHAERNFFQVQVFQLRKYLLNDIRANPALMEKYMSRKLARDRSPVKRLQLRLGLGLNRLTQRFPAVRRGYHGLERKIFSSKRAVEQLRTLAPNLLVSTYPVLPPEAEYVLAARELGIPSVLHLLSWDNITAKGVFPALPDRYVVWGEVMAEELRHYYGVAGAAIEKVGVPHFDLHVRARDKGAADLLLELGLDPALPYLFFAMSAPRFCPREIDIVEWLAHKVAGGELSRPVQLVVRPHPQNVEGDMADLSWLPRIDALKLLDRVAVIYPIMNTDSRLLYSINEQDMDTFTRLLAGSSVLLNSGSTVSIDAMMTDRPVVLTSFDADATIDYWLSARRLRDYTHLAKIIALGGIRVTTDYAALEASIEDYLTDPGRDGEARRETIAAYCTVADGTATQRAADYYLNRLN